MNATRAFIDRISELSAENAKLKWVAGRMLHRLQQLERSGQIAKQDIVVLETMALLAGIEPKEAA